MPSSSDPELVEVVERIVSGAHGSLDELVVSTLAGAETADDATVAAVRRS